jgi:hypothetical protein
LILKVGTYSELPAIPVSQPKFDAWEKRIPLNCEKNNMAKRNLYKLFDSKLLSSYQ